jgi:hypothetical protein
MNVPFEETASTPINFDAFGNRNYTVTAAGVSFRCSVDENGTIQSFSRA